LLSPDTDLLGQSAPKGRGASTAAVSQPVLRRVASQSFSDLSVSFDRRPARSPLTEMSSSRSGQWMPRPRPMSSQFDHSLGDPFASRGYHERGTEMLRPSESATVRASDVTVTPRASTVVSSVREELIPCLDQHLSTLNHYSFDSIELLCGEPTVEGKREGIEPELRFGVVTPDVDVHRLAAIVGVEEESVRARTKHRRSHTRGYGRTMTSGPANCPLGQRVHSFGLTTRSGAAASCAARSSFRHPVYQLRRSSDSCLAGHLRRDGCDSGLERRSEIWELGFIDT